MANTLKFGNGEWYGKKNTILAYNDENNNFKPLPFNFERASSATVVNKDGLIETVGSGIPRIDFQGNTKGAMLLEPSRTNLVSYSEDFNLLVKKNNAVVTSNATLSPSGSLNADEITFDGTAYGRVEAVVSATVGQTYTISLYLKNKDLSDVTQVWIGFSQSSQGGYVTITNEWQRYDITTTSDGTSEYPRIQFGGTGSLYAWGFQTEQGSYSTSYIPTSGSAVTRVAESCNNGGNDQVINSTEGVFYFNSSTLQDTADRKISLSDGTSTNRIEIVFVGLGNLIYMDIKNSNGLNLGNSTTISSSVSLLKKYAVRWSNNNYSFWVNGVKEIEVLTGNTFNPNSLSTVNLSNYSNSQDFYGKVKDLRVYNTALTDQELIALTQV